MKHLIAALVAAALLGRRARSSAQLRPRRRRLGVGDDVAPAKAGTRQGHEEEGEEIHGRGACVRRVAHEVK